MDENNTQKKSRRFLVIYCIAIFAFAAALILLSSLSQARLAREADAIKDKLSSTETLAEGAQSQLRAIMAEKQSLEDSIALLEKEKAELSEKNTALTAENGTLTKKLSASQSLSKLVDLKRLRKNTEFKRQLKAFQSNGYPALLSSEELKIYNSIK